MFVKVHLGSELLEDNFEGLGPTFGAEKAFALKYS